MARTFIMLNWSGKSWHPCLIPDHRGISLSVVPLSIVLVWFVFVLFLFLVDILDQIEKVSFSSWFAERFLFCICICFVFVPYILYSFTPFLPFFGLLEYFLVFRFISSVDFLFMSLLFSCFSGCSEITLSVFSTVFV